MNSVPGTAGVSPVPGSTEQVNYQPWHSRYYLPHFDRPGCLQMITFRLADSLPAEVLAQLEFELRQCPDATAERRRRLIALLGAGYGMCHLREARIARLVEDALLHFDGIRYRVLAWCIMPNHVHMLIETMPTHELAALVHSWKSFTAKEANKILGRTGAFWYQDYFDRAIRDERHFAAALKYIHENPVKAGLVDLPERWPYGSARFWIRRPGTGGTPAVPGTGSTIGGEHGA